MENKNLLISFCIPTYNRASYLPKSLDAIILQLDEDSKKNVEILISDNASDDATVEVVQGYIQSRPDLNIRFLKNPSNIGMDGNFINCYKNAIGKYVCLVSDDDFLLPGKVKYLLDIFHFHPDIDAVFLNPFPIAGCLQETEKLCFNSNEMMERIGDRIVHLGALIFKREIFMKRDYSCYDGTYLAISYIFLDVIMNGDGIYFTREKFFQITQNNSGGYNFFDVFITRFLDVLDYASQKGFSKKAVDKVKNQHLRYFVIPFVIDFRINNSYKRMKRSFSEGFFLIFRRYASNPMIIWGVIPAMFAPKFFWVFIRSIVRLIRRISVWNAVKGGC